MNSKNVSFQGTVGKGNGVNIPYSSVIEPVGGVQVLVGAIGKGAMGVGAIIERLLPKPEVRACEYLIGDRRLEKPYKKGL